jgi:hypothetical protein
MPLNTGQTSLLLIEAPAAVGKSMLAEEISYRTGASLWNLGAFHVGDDTFIGRIGKCFGDELYSTIMKRLAQGDFLVILDALDEGRLLAGDDNFLPFLTTLAERLKEPRQRPCVIILGRADSIELALLTFDERTCAHLEIEFFEREAANDLVAKQLDSLCASRSLAPLHRQHRGAFAKARDAFFERAAEVLGARPKGAEISWNNPAVRSFLGYAPVLVAVAEYLVTVEEARDYGVLEEKLHRTQVSAGPTAAWELFGKTLDRILEREQQKATGDGLTATAAKFSWTAMAKRFIQRRSSGFAFSVGALITTSANAKEGISISKIRPFLPDLIRSCVMSMKRQSGTTSPTTLSWVRAPMILPGRFFGMIPMRGPWTATMSRPNRRSGLGYA